MGLLDCWWDLRILASDNPIVYEEPDECGSSVVYLPCGPEHILAFNRRDDGEDEKCVMSDRAVNYFNLRLTGQSDLIIGNTDWIVNRYKSTFSKGGRWIGLTQDRHIYERFGVG